MYHFCHYINIKDVNCPKKLSDQWHFKIHQYLITFCLIEPFKINAWHAGYKQEIIYNPFYTLLLVLH